jgi:hypothetical protein
LRTFLILLSALFVLSLSSYAQEKLTDSRQKEKSKTQKHGLKEEEEEDPNPFPQRKIEFGLNFGAYFANKNSANFYNGAPYNVNNLNYLMSNIYTYRDIKTAMGLSESDVLLVDGYAMNMHYNVGFSGGLFMRVNINRKNGFFLEANYAMLRAEDVVTMKVNPDTYLTFDDIRTEPVIGKEGRVMIDLGYQRSFPLRSRINLFIQGGLTMCYTQVIKSIFVAESTEFSLVNIYGPGGYQQGQNNQTFTVNQNAFGFGGMLGVGAGIPLNAMWGLEPGFFMHYYPTNLEGYSGFNPSFGLYLRILMHFGATDE